MSLSLRQELASVSNSDKRGMRGQLLMTLPMLVQKIMIVVMNQMGANQMQKFQKQLLKKPTKA